MTIESPLVDVAVGDVNTDDADTGRSPRFAASGILAGILLALVVVALLPTLWGAVSSMGAPQWLEALAIGLLFVPAAVGVYITFRVLDFPDLTVDGSFPAGGAIAATLITSNVSPWLALPAAMLLGAALGVVTGCLHVYLRINSLLASIITLTAAFTVNLRVQGSANISLLNVDRIFTLWIEPIRNQLETWFGETGVQIHRAVTTSSMTIIIAAVMLLALRWFFATEVGLGLRATGANREMSQSQGINTARYLIGGVAVSNALVGLSGALFVQHAGFADINSGSGLIVSGLAAVIIGEVLFGSKARSMAMKFVAVGLGMLAYRVAIALALNADLRFPGTGGFRLEASDIKLATAAVVVAMLALPRFRESRKERARRRART
jgi:putative ABC transport system permease protein